MKTINTADLQRVIGDDSELLADVAIMFVHTLPEVKARIQFGIENREAAEIADAAHQIRGRVSYFGANGLKNLASQIEAAARKNQLAEVPALSNVLFEGIDQLLKELRELTKLSLEVNDD